MTVVKPRMTEEELMRLPKDGYTYELIDGEAKGVPTSFDHDIIGGNVYAALRPFATGRGFMSIGQAGFRMKSGNIRCPDVSFTSKDRLPGGKPGKGFGDAAPDLCVEIISPSEEPGDMARKVYEYFDSGASLVWHMLPETQTIRVFISPTEATVYEAQDEIATGNILPGFRCRVADLFALE